MIKIILGVIFTAIIAFSLGCYAKEQEHMQNRKQRCETLILFAIDKADNHDTSNHGVMEALISNVYAAYEYCDDSLLAGQLHDLWNTLIFEDETSSAAISQELKTILQTLQSNH